MNEEHRSTLSVTVLLDADSVDVRDGEHLRFVRLQSWPKEVGETPGQLELLFSRFLGGLTLMGGKSDMLRVLMSLLSCLLRVMRGERVKRRSMRSEQHAVVAGCLVFRRG